MGKQTTTASWIAAAILVAIVVIAGGYLVHRALQPKTVEAPVAAAAAGAEAGLRTNEAPSPARPAPAPTSTAVLPALADSDADVAAGLAALAGDHLGDVLVPKQIIARLVATIDALPRHAGLGPNVLPARPPRGAVVLTTTPAGPTLAAGNAGRYAPYMALIENVDPERLVAWYRRMYPLFQEAYRELGYPDGQFNARLMVVIDDLLAAPDGTTPAPLRQTQAYYTYVDPALESLSTGQKLLLRTGTANAAVIKAKLRAIRAALLASGTP